MDGRFDGADRAVAVLATLDGSDACDPLLRRTSRRSGDTGAEVSAHAILPIAKFVDLMEMALSTSTGQCWIEDRERFVRDVRSAGGYCAVELETPEIDVVDGMWDCVGTVFGRESGGRGDGGGDRDPLPLKLRHQTLARCDSAETHEKSGYEFVQISLGDGSLLRLGDTFGKDTADRATRAYRLLSVLGRAFATVVLAGSMPDAFPSPGDASDFCAAMLDGEDEGGHMKPLCGAYHRLCRYVEPDGGSGGGEIAEGDKVESLRSHGDWTLATAIPVSTVSGLEIYNPTLRCWVRPESILSRRYLNRQRGSGGTAGESPDRKWERWNSRYVVLMAGNWLELAACGRVESSVHRVVVSDRNASGGSRLSAPFFMRPKQEVFDATESMEREQGGERASCSEQIGARLIQLYAEKAVGSSQS